MDNSQKTSGDLPSSMQVGKPYKVEEKLSSFLGARIEDVLKRSLWNLE